MFRSSAVLRRTRWQPHSARFRLVRTGETSRRHPLTGGLQMSGAHERRADADDSQRHRSTTSGDGGRDRRRCSPAVPPGWVLDATVGGGGHSELLLDRPPAPRASSGSTGTSGAGRRRRAPRPVRRAGPPVPLPLRPPPRRHGSPLHRPPHRCPVRPRRQLAAARPRRARLLLPDDAPLDMRMDPTQPWSAADVVNGYPSGAAGRRASRDHGDERFASRIAAAIVAARPIETTAELAEIVVAAIPARRPAHRRAPGQAHVPGDPHRGQRRARGPAARPSTTAIEAHRTRRPHRRARRTTPARTASSRSASARR